MAESRRSAPVGGLYERLLQRLAMALDEADSLGKFSAQPPQELELRGLTAAEMELIRAYLERDLDWLRGWHAAAQEMAQISQLPSARKVGRSGHKPTAALPGKVKPLLKRRLQLCCALCGTLVGWQLGTGVQVCKACGSQLFRASNHR
jgi:ribosomal protein L37AE/L43A